MDRPELALAKIGVLGFLLNDVGVLAPLMYVGEGGLLARLQHTLVCPHGCWILATVALP